MAQGRTPHGAEIGGDDRADHLVREAIAVPIGPQQTSMHGRVERLRHLRRIRDPREEERWGNGSIGHGRDPEDRPHDGWHGVDALARALRDGPGQALGRASRVAPRTQVPRPCNEEKRHAVRALQHALARPDRGAIPEERVEEVGRVPRS